MERGAGEREQRVGEAARSRAALGAGAGRTERLPEAKPGPLTLPAPALSPLPSLNHQWGPAHTPHTTHHTDPSLPQLPSTAPQLSPQRARPTCDTAWRHRYSIVSSFRMTPASLTMPSWPSEL